jgi:hypothetical protein
MTDILEFPIRIFYIFRDYGKGVFNAKVLAADGDGWVADV